MAHELPYSAKWKASKESRRLYQALVDGNKSILNSEAYLPRNDIEKNPQDGAVLYSIRQKVSYYRNRVAPYIRKWTAKTFSAELLYDLEYSEQYGAFLESCIGGSEPLSFQQFLSSMFLPSYLTQGGASIMLDAPMVDGIVSVEEEERYKPYCKVVSMLDLVYCEKSPWGNYTRADIEYKEASVNADGSLQYKLKRKVHQLTESGVEVTEYAKDEQENTWEQTAEPITLGLTFIPLFTLNGDSWVSELSEEAVELHNKRSGLSMILHQQGRLIRYLKSSTTAKGKVDISEWSWLKLGPNDEIGQLEPIYPQALIEEIKALVVELDQKASQMARFVPADSKAVQSADSQEAAEGPLEQATAELRRRLEGFSNIVLNHVPRFYGRDWLGEKPCYFGTNAQDDHTMAAEHAAIAALFPEEFARSATWRAETIKALLSSDKVLMDENKIAQILAELGYSQ